MINATAVYKSVNGPYEWGKHDCALTIHGLAKAVSPEAGERYWSQMKRLHDMPEPKAFRAFMRRGGFYKVQTEALGPHFMIVEDGSIRPGDIRFYLEGKLELANHAEETARKKYELMGFRDNGLQCLYWGAPGLLPIIKYPDNYVDLRII